MDHNFKLQAKLANDRYWAHTPTNGVFLLKKIQRLLENTGGSPWAICENVLGESSTSWTEATPLLIVVAAADLQSQALKQQEEKMGYLLRYQTRVEAN